MQIHADIEVNLAKVHEFTVGGFWIPNPDPEPGFEKFVKKPRIFIIAKGSVIL
jgi:hypothetical protein